MKNATAAALILAELKTGATREAAMDAVLGVGTYAWLTTPEVRRSGCNARDTTTIEDAGR